MKVLQNTKNFCLHYDESILNCTLLGISVFIMKKMDEEIVKEKMIMVIIFPWG